MIQRHPVDKQLVGDMMEHIEKYGYTWTPVVMDGDIIIDGHHRYEAMRELDYASYEIPTIELSDIENLDEFDPELKYIMEEL